MQPIYLDYNATTPLDPEVFAAMEPFLTKVFGNPSSVHQIGRDARAVLDDARDRLAGLWKSKPSEVVFTSGGTESANLAVFGAARSRREVGRHIVTSPIEHPAVLQAIRFLEAEEGYSVTIVPVSEGGLVDPDTVRLSIRKDTCLVSIMAANNEVGSIQPVAEIGRLCRERGVLFHTDAVQWFGKLPFSSIHQFEADLVSICSHKFYGPKGCGALFVRSPLQLKPLLFGGGHENDRRAGTENLAAIIGFVDAFARFVPDPVFLRNNPDLLSHTLLTSLGKLPGVLHQGDPNARLANTCCFTVEGSDSISLLAGLDMEGICASSGSACSSGSLEPSHVLKAMGVRSDLASSLVRFSFGRDTTQEEVIRACSVFDNVIKRTRSV